MSDSVDEIKSKIDIYSLVSEYVSLKKSGKNYKGLCPFHGEKTPSFMVNPERGSFKCFGCSEGGDIFSFLEKIENLTFAEALKTLAKRAGVELQQVQIDPVEKEKDLFIEIHQKAAQFYNFLLLKHPVGLKAREYLGNRGVEEKTCEEYLLGFAPNKRDALSRFLVKKGFTPKALLAAGVSLPDGRGIKDRFYSRVLFPIKNLQGQVVGFSGRIIGEGEPKYLNSPDSLIFTKSKLLFGMDVAKTEVKKTKELILVEGNFDVLLSHQAGVKNVVAPLGTGLGETQIGLVKRFTENLAICFDTDSAGRSATMRGLEMAENAGLSVSVITTDDKDPAELITKNPALWIKAIKSKTPVLDYYLDTFIKRFGLDTAEGKRKIALSYLPILGKIEDPLIRTHYLQKAAALLRVGENLLLTSLEKYLPTRSVTPKIPNPAVPAIARQPLNSQVEKYLLALILQTKVLPKKLMEIGFRDMSFESIKRVLDSLAREGKESFDIPEILGKLTDTEKKLVDDLLLFEVPEEVLADDDKIFSEIGRCIKRIKEVNLRLDLRKLAVEVKQAEAAKDNQRLEDLNKKFRDLSVQLLNLGA